jgi:hypothetical protein
VITRDDVLAAHSRIRDHIRHAGGPGRHPYPLWIKCEFMHT